MTTYAIGYVTSSKIILVGFVQVSHRTADREKILDKVFTNSDFVRVLDIIDEEWWYKTDRLVVSLYR